MLEAGADFSLREDQGDGIWIDAFMDVVEFRSLVSTPINSQL